MVAKSLALVTGASSGIGYELAIQFAKADFDLIIVADNDAIHGAQAALKKMGPEVTALQADLTTPQGVEQVAELVKKTGRPLGALALNAGIGASGAFLDAAFEEDLHLIKLNIVSTLHLAKLLVPDLVKAGEGRVLFTSSVASLGPGPYHAVYHASKAFIQSFAAALREELKSSGVSVTSLLPGATETPFFARAHMLDTKIGQHPKDDPAEVARQGFEALMRGDAQVIAGSFLNKVQSVMSHLSSDAMTAKQVGPRNKPLVHGDEDSVDAIQMLKEQHRQAEALFQRIDKAEGGERAAIFKTLADKLLEHMTIEEEVFYPAALEVDRLRVEDSRDEHEAARHIILQVLNAQDFGADSAALVKELQHKIQQHVEHEEKQLFPECAKSMTKEYLIDLADAMRDRTVAIETQDTFIARPAPGRSPAEGVPLA